MTNEAEKAQLSGLIELVRQGISSMAQAQRERARLTAVARAGGRRVTVTVNADGVVIKTQFSDNIDDLTYSEIADAVTAATQEAAAEVQRKSLEIQATLEQEQARIPAFAEFFPNMPEIRSTLPTPPVVSTAPPGSPERDSPDTESEVPVEFTDVEDYEHDRQSRGRSSIAAPEW